MWNEEVRVVQELAEEVMQEVKKPQLDNPKATFREIEAAVDRSWAPASEATEVSGGPEGRGSQCPQCGHPLESRGRRTRSLITNYNQSISLKRSYGVCPACGTGLFPRDEELKLEPGSLTPNLAEDMVLSASWMPLAAAVQVIGHFWKVAMSEATVRRATEGSDLIESFDLAREERGLPLPFSIDAHGQTTVLAEFIILAAVSA